MRGPILRALVSDSWQQVLDNKVFRLLLVVSLFLVLPTFLIGFHEEHIDVLFGWKTISYEGILSAFSDTLGASSRIEEPGTVLAMTLQEWVVSGFAGTFGVIFAIAATAFFMPRMMERGSADTLFSKPVPRWALLLSRYVSGILFVAVLAFLLVLGMYVGFRVRSGYDDPGFLWSALTLVYLYSALHAFSLLVATVSRSSVAAILLTLVLFAFSGCVHQVWITWEFADHRQETVEAIAALDRQAARQALEQGQELTPEEQELAAREKAEGEDAERFVAIVRRTLNTLHYLLPKTTDTDLLVRRLKRSFVPTFALEDEEGHLHVEEDLDGWRLVTPPDADLDVEPAIWVPEGAPDDSPVSITLSRTPRQVERDGRSRTLTSLSAAGDFADRLAARGVTDVQRESDRIEGASLQIVRWSEEGQAREHWFFTHGRWMFEVDARVPPGAAADADEDVEATEGTTGEGQGEAPPEADDDRVASGETGSEIGDWQPRLEREIELSEEMGLSMGVWYEEQFRLDAPLRYNVAFSIGSTVAFALLSLLLASWRLRRIDF